VQDLVGEQLAHAFSFVPLSAARTNLCVPDIISSVSPFNMYLVTAGGEGCDLLMSYVCGTEQVAVKGVAPGYFKCLACSTQRPLSGVDCRHCRQLWQDLVNLGDAVPAELDGYCLRADMASIPLDPATSTTSDRFPVSLPSPSRTHLMAISYLSSMTGKPGPVL